MHRSVALLLATIALVGAAALAGATPPSEPVSPASAPALDGRSTANGTVAGTVTAPNGTSDAVVAAVPSDDRALFEKRRPDELYDLVTNEASDDLHVASVDTDGAYALSLPAGNYSLIALTPTDASAVRQVSVVAGERTTVDLAVRDLRPLRLHVGAGEAETGGTLTVTVDARTVDSEPVANLSLALALPEGWTVIESSVERGRWDGERGAWTFETLEPGTTVTAELVVAVGDEPGEYTVAVRATAPGADGAAVDLGAASDAVRVREEITTTPARTTRAPAGGDGADGTTTIVDDPSPVPGFGVTVALVALAFAVAPLVLGTVLVRRR